MDKYVIGLNAGKVWLLLSKHEKWGYDELKCESGLGDRDFAAAIGWLAREDKIEFHECEKDSYIYLCVNVYIG